jgi:hypothetical protein
MSGAYRSSSRLDTGDRESVRSTRPSSRVASKKPRSRESELTAALSPSRTSAPSGTTGRSTQDRTESGTTSPGSAASRLTSQPSPFGGMSRSPRPRQGWPTTTSPTRKCAARTLRTRTRSPSRRVGSMLSPPTVTTMYRRRTDKTSPAAAASVRPSLARRIRPGPFRRVDNPMPACGTWSRRRRSAASGSYGHRSPRRGRRPA